MTKNPYVYRELRRTGSPANRPADALIRLATATLLVRASSLSPLAHISHDEVAAIAEQNWPDDDVVLTLNKAASLPATTTGTSWASELAGASVTDFFTSMGPQSAGAALLAAGLQFEFGTSALITVPTMLSAAANAAFVKQGDPIQVRQLAITNPTPQLTPRKLAAIAVFSREIFEHSIPSIESVVGTVLRESVQLKLDATMLDATAGDETRPAGLRNGIGASATSANANLGEAMLEDIDTVVAVVAAVAGNSQIILVASPSRARRMKLRLASVIDPGFTIMGSAAVGANDLIAIASNGLASAADPTPRVTTSTQASVVLDDATPPGQLVVGASTASGPARSMWQADNVGLRVIFEVSWALRSPTALAWTQNVIW
jgi:Phage capsid family